MAATASLESLVDEWLRLDKHETTRNEIAALWRSGNTVELESRLRTRIDFGTAGLRGKMEAGFSRMNDLVIIQASQGLCAYVLEKVHDAANRGVVIGHDHRHNSERWASLTATVFLQNGFKVYLHRGLVHTPLVPFTVSTLATACGVMITASHNPKDDNGYKVYWENAVQIIPPHDKGISDSIKAHLEPQSATWQTSLVDSSPKCIDRTNESKDAYFGYLSTLSLKGAQHNGSITTKFVSTPMHGVGYPFAARGFSVFGLPPFTSVAAQQDPDPNFSTVTFPNPEEDGALDLATSEGDKVGAAYVLAQDPDADRFSASQRSREGRWINITGDQLGVLFAGRIIDHYRATGGPLDNVAMIASTVSSKMLEAMSKKEGFRFVECLTGFKYIGNTALDLVGEGYEVPFGYEEAIGFMFGDRVRDKDGIAATVCFAELVGSLEKDGKTALGYLDELYERYGFFLTSNSYYVCRDPPTIDRVFERLRSFNAGLEEGKANYPNSLAGQRITRIVDLTVGYDNANPPTFKPSLPLSSGHMIQFRTDVANETQLSLTIRTSGTEPKIKYYLEGSGTNPSAVRALLKLAVEELDVVWMEAGKNNLTKPGLSFVGSSLSVAAQASARFKG